MSSYDNTRIRRTNMKTYASFSQAKKETMARMAQQRRAIKMARRTSLPPTIVYARPGELKCLDTVLTYTPVIQTTSTNAGIFLLNAVSEGPAAYQRIGRKVQMKSVRIRGSAALKVGVEATTSDRLGNTLRMTIVHDNQPGVALPTFAEMFANIDYAGTETSTVLAALNPKRTYRFKVLKDCVYTLNAESAPTGGTENDWVGRVQIDEYIRMNYETQYSGTASPVEVTQISTGALYVVFRALNNATSSQWSIEDTTWGRLRYSDD